MMEWAPQPEPSSSTTGLSDLRRSAPSLPPLISLSNALVVGSSCEEKEGAGEQDWGRPGR